MIRGKPLGNLGPMGLNPFRVFTGGFATLIWQSTSLE
jgi:hypothetical protein